MRGKYPAETVVVVLTHPRPIFYVSIVGYGRLTLHIS